MATDLWAEGPNHGSTSTQGGGVAGSISTSGTSTLTVSTSNVPGGGSSYCWVHNAQTARVYRTCAVSTTDRFIMGQVWFRFDTLPTTGECSIFGFSAASGVVGQVVYTASDNMLKVRIGSSGTAMGTSVVANTSYRLDMRYDTDGTTWTMDAWIDGADQTTQTSAQPGNSTVDQLRWGPTGSPNCVLRLANTVVRSDTASPSLWNSMRVKLLSVTADGTHAVGSGAFKDNAGTTLNNATTTAYQRLDEVPMSGTTDWIEQTVVDASGYMELAFDDDTTGGTVIQGSGLVAYHAGGTAKASVFSSATESVVFSGSMNVAGTLTFKRVVIAPTGGTWSTAKLNALVGRIGYASAVGTTPKWDSFIVEYAYEPTTSTNVNESETFAYSETESNSGSGVSGTPSFTGSGIHGGGFQNVVAVSDDGTKLLSGADVAGVHMSTDDGVSWQAVFRGMGQKADTNCAAVKFYPGSSVIGFFAAGPGSGLWRSDDLGTTNTWAKVNASIEYRAGNFGANNLGLPEKHPRPTGNLIDFGGTSTNAAWRWLYTASFNDGIYRSPDGGTTLTRIVGTANSNIYTRALAVDTITDTTLYAGAYATTASTGGLWRIRNANGGTSQNATAASWAKMASPFNSVDEVVTIGTTTCRVYVAGSLLTFDGSGNVTARTDGVWTATDPTGASSGEWTRLGAGALPTNAQWESVEAYRRTGQPDVIYVGCGDAQPVGDGTYHCLYRSLDAGVSWTRMAPSTTYVRNEIGGAGGAAWWLYSSAAYNRLGLGNAYVASQIVSNPADRTKVYISGRSGVWLTRNGEATQPTWYPSVAKMGVTINPNVVSDPNTTGRVYFDNVDYVFWYSTDNGATVTQKSPGVPGAASGAAYAMAIDTGASPAHVYIGVGDRDSNIAGGVYKNTNPATQSWTNTNFLAAGGGARPMGMAVRRISGTAYVLLAAVNGGIWMWDQSSWTRLLQAGSATGFSTDATPALKRIPVVWCSQNLAYVYDYISGLWRGTTTTTTLDTWDHIWTQTTTSRGSAHLAVDPNDTGKVWISTGAGLYRLDSASAGSGVGSGITQTKITNIVEPGPIGYDPTGFFYCWEQSPVATLKRTTGINQATPSWTDVADNFWQGWGQFPNSIDLQTAGYIYASGEGTGAAIGTNATTTTFPISQSETYTLSESETVNQSVFTTLDEADDIAYSESEVVSATVDVTDSFTYFESETNSGASVTTTGPPPPGPGPKIRHVFISPQGTATPTTGAWQTDEQVGGGFMSGSGEVQASLIAELPSVFVAGSKWQVWAEDELLWEGHLLDPIVQSGVAKLSGRGWGWLAERDSGRMLFASRDYTDWVPADSEPFNLNVSESYSVSAESGRLLWIGQRGEDVPAGRQAGLVFFADGSEVSSVAGTMVWNGNGSTNQVFQVEAADWPENLNQQGGNIAISDGGTFDRNITLRDADTVRLRVQRVDGPATFADTFRFAVTDLVVRGISQTDTYSSSDVVREVMGRLGIEDFQVDDTGDSILPLDWKDGTFAALLDYASLFSGVPWLIMSTGSTRYARFREPETYFTTRAMGATELVPVTRYNRVLVTWTHTNGRSRQTAVTAEDVGVVDPYAATGYTNTSTVALDQPQHNDDVPRAIAERLLAQMIKERYTGSLERQWVTDRAGSWVSAYKVRAGDRIVVQDGKPDAAVRVRVDRKVSTGTGVRFDLETNDVGLDRWLRRREARGLFSL